jgi:hypothetical protein
MNVSGGCLPSLTLVDDDRPMSTTRKSKRDLSDALACFEAFIWIAFGVIGPVIWMYKLFEAGRYPVFGFVGFAWLLSLGVYAYYLFTRKLAMLAVVLLIIWCVSLLIAFW